MEQKVIEAITEGLRNVLEERQKLPDQYIVAYKRKDESLIGYHADSFGTLTQDILHAKRYSGDNPYEQLKVIWKNLEYRLNRTEEDQGFLGISYLNKQKYYKDLTIDDIYIDAVYLADGTPPQRFNITILNAEENGTENNEREGD